MRTHGKNRHTRKRKKYTSKYYRLYGYSIKDIVDILGWSYGTVHSYFNNDKKRKEMLDFVKTIQKAKK